MKKVVKNGRNKKLKMSREIKCPACKAVFPTKESMSLHTCNSILDRHISEEGKERQKIPTVSQNLKTVKLFIIESEAKKNAKLKYSCISRVSIFAFYIYW